ncbi:VacJ family lipoprotein [Campylobacter sp. 2018MI01]|uniref:MlaA family lipoprotein n=1 Tax=Campylobacter sp. 2018MI01 TaxID=2836735 RepID=UPI001BD9CCC2|nr:VacJ family lipoprotein [Campylobacter sp. 2018MI01]
MIKKLFFILSLITLVVANEIDDFEAEFNQVERVDKFYNYNKAVTSFNYAVYNMSLRPLSNIYNTITPPIVKKGVNNFFHNLGSPLRFITLYLSGEFKSGTAELGAFLGNTTLGLGGILRPFKYEKESDFGLMLARWGVPPGEHIVLPFLGPANVRDALALPFDYALKPSFYLTNNASISVSAFGLIDKTSSNSVLINEAYKSINPYVTIRDFYEKNRKELE